jgi:hypothetical protein
LTSYVRAALATMRGFAELLVSRARVGMQMKWPFVKLSLSFARSFRFIAELKFI